MACCEGLGALAVAEGRTGARVGWAGWPPYSRGCSMRTTRAWPQALHSAAANKIAA